MKLSLDANAQLALLTALQGLDGYDDVVPANGKVPARAVRVQFKLGLVRREVVKNINALTASLGVFEQSRRALRGEFFPEVAANVDLTEAQIESKPEFSGAMRALIETKEDIELHGLPAEAVYGAGDIPTAILALLDKHGLIIDAAPPAAASAA